MSILFTRRGTPPSLGKKASDYAVGESVYLIENGAQVEYLVVHQGLPDATLYDASCNGTWLLRKAIYANRAVNSGTNDYSGVNSIHNYLNNDFINLFDDATKAAVKQVKIPHSKGYLYPSTAFGGADGLDAKIFLLAYCEIGGSAQTHIPEDGVKLDYFPAGSDNNTSRIAYLNNTATNWWLRTAITSSSVGGSVVGAKGNILGSYNVTSSFGIRPALIVQSNTKFDSDTNVIK